MADVNYALVKGRLGRDPSYSIVNGDLKCDFSLCNEPWPSNKARYWLHVQCRKGVAEIARDHMRLVKGDLITVDGMVMSYKITLPDGTKHDEQYFRAFHLYLVIKARQGGVRPQPALGPDLDPIFSPTS